jgi:hypothetical protein
MFGAQGLSPRRDLYRAAPAVIRNLIFSGSSEGPPHFVASFEGAVEDTF